MASIARTKSSNRAEEEKHMQHITGQDFGAFDKTEPASMSTPKSPLTSMRRESYHENTSAFSSSEGAWSGFHFSIENGNSDATATSQAFLQPALGPSINNSQNGPSMIQPAWIVNRPSGSCTPTPGVEQIVEFDDGADSTFGQQSLPSHQQSFEVMAGAPHTFNIQTRYPNSPQSSRGGWVSASPPGVPDSRNGPQGTLPNSPILGTTTQVLRRDGIRKKNARFEIPAERNLRTIDQLINQTSDEQEIKELKQQKRLLRNRQAALDSRQRKKLHTERLEEEKKHYTSVISDLEEALGDMKLQEAEWMQEKENYVVSQQQYQRYINTLEMEKEDIVRRHTIETGELRKKNAILIDQLQRLEGTAMSTAPSSTGFSADFSDFDHLTMNSWDDFSMPNDFSIEIGPRPDAQPLECNKRDPPREMVGMVPEDDKALSSGLLLMLLLCGAWVASRGSISSTNPLPAMSDELRSASATVLDNLYKDSGVHIHEHQYLNRKYPSALSENALQAAKPGASSFDCSGTSRSPLEALHHRLTTPSDHQIHEQEFSLTPSQYNDLSATRPYYPPPSHEPRSAKSIGEILANTHIPGERVAETYTRSLMKDRVSTQVLQDFARMVAQNNLGSLNQWKSEPID